MNERLAELNKCLLSFGIDPLLNINGLVALCCHQLKASGAYYVSANNGKSPLAVKWSVPIDYQNLNEHSSRVCNDIIKKKKSVLQVNRNYCRSKYAKHDPNIIKNNLKTLIGTPVKSGRSTHGCLCLVFQKDRKPINADQNFLGLIASAIAIEEERRLSQEAIQNSLQEKEILLKELHHRVKNNMQVISSLLYLQSADLEDEKILSLFQESTNRVRTMSLVYEKLFQSADFTNLNFDNYVNDLVSYLIDTHSTRNNILKNIEIDNIFMCIDSAIPCGLIINELVTNSIKYAFPGTFNKIPEINISLKLINGQYNLKVADNGIGLPDNISLEHGPKTLGLKLINMLTAQLYGKIQLERNNGTEFQLIFNEKI